MTRPTAKPVDAYLGPLCPVCHMPIACHPIPREDSGCCSHMPAGFHLNPPDPAWIGAREIDAAEIAAARERYHQRAAPPPPPPPPVAWAVQVRTPGDDSGEATETGEIIMAIDEAEALMKAGTRHATGRVSVRPVAEAEAVGHDDWRAGKPAKVGA